MSGPIRSRLKAIHRLYNQYWDEQYAARESGYWLQFFGYDEVKIASLQKVPERKRWSSD